MYKIRVALLGSVALLILGSVTSSAASAAGPYWRVNGSRLETGAKQAKVSAGATELKAKLLGIGLTIQCEAASVAGASIIGNETSQGQDEAKSITFEKCKLVAPAKCLVEPIKTLPVKSHLAINGTQIVDLFEPTTGTAFTTITIKNGSEKCSVAGKYPVMGDIAAEVKPEGTEVKSGELLFPGTPIKAVKKEGGSEEAIGLEIGNKGNPASFSGKFAVGLESGEAFGAFTT
jgi:hypothetical protein